MIIRQEKFPSPGGVEEFKPLWDAHGVEIRGKPFVLNLDRYREIEGQGRLVWIVARETNLPDLPPVGYSCHWHYHSMHWDERVGVDDLWFVLPGWRGNGIGSRMKQMGLDLLREAGAVETSDTVRFAANVDYPLGNLGYKPWGTRFKKALAGPASSGG
jgi:GNAT superfamily N-acetyltransferase